MIELDKKNLITKSFEQKKNGNDEEKKSETEKNERKRNSDEKCCYIFPTQLNRAIEVKRGTALNVDEKIC